ncbi:LuxR C-terminal-related transcriptional regulator [Thalassobius sp. Cn5-15]|uniref:helix-turn-helix transcriptional regulator n=1 Tax=Thalassobius sp. Cn5-15 TaxID=2917763 RepID=UPI001EF31F75|nr:LuxR C-terminal-related transcriptional regulator [Thalassobius sp. Cn5-15]MCG7493321.1 LuxR C-terminal-related transcriptional regulator [Thalassobius sp. Cn5-15]
MTKSVPLIILILLQAICAVFFVSDILATVVGLRASPISWQTRELLEVGAALGLILGVVLGWIAFRRSMQRTQQAEESLRVVQSAFHDHLEERFRGWALTPAEREVALFSLKGCSIEEIASLRNTSPGTVKAQSNAIYRKAEVSNRAQLLSLFIEDLLDGTHEAGEAGQGDRSAQSIA